MRQNFAQIVTRVQENVGINEATYDTKIKNWINEVYEDIWDTFFWPGSLIRGNVSTVASQAFVNLPPQVRRLLFLSQTATPAWLRFSDTAQFVRENYLILTTTGTPSDYTDDGESPVLAQPAAASTISLSSSSASDVSQTVRLHGRDSNGLLQTEAVQLSGLTAVVSTKSYVTLEMVAKSAVSVGTVTATSDAGATTVARIAPRELDSKCLRVRLSYIPDAVITLNWIGKRHLYRLENDEDQLLIDMDSAVVAGTTALALREQGDQKSEVWAERAAGIIQKRRDEILGQSMRSLKLQPDVGRRQRSNFYGDWSQSGAL